MNGIAGLSFGAPWILAALVLLPAIWWLLRVTPPAPRRVVFPPFRLLLGLEAPQETPARTPLALLLLRIVVAGLIIVAFAEPTIGRLRQAATGHGPLVLFVDNDWAGAQHWNDREAALSEVLADAESAGRAVAIVPTASLTPPSVSLLDAGEAERQARALEPQSFPADRKRAAAALAKFAFPSRPGIVWLSNDLDFGDAAATARTLSAAGNLRIYADSSGRTPVALSGESVGASGFVAKAIRADSGAARDATVEALGAHGENLASAQLHFAAGDAQGSVEIALPLEVRNEARRLAIAGADSAGALRLLGSNARRLSVGLVSASNLETEQPLLSSLFYLKRALSPFADVREGTIESELARNDS
ncbi:MAG TPA: BatA domain-containing protein, partial [Rhizomicrobium sp.]|nr:BatA domain-containing protein [Rhizomicrobium sp.]